MSLESDLTAVPDTNHHVRWRRRKRCPGSHEETYTRPAERVHMERYPGSMRLYLTHGEIGHPRERWSRPNPGLERDDPAPVHTVGERPSPIHAPGEKK